jgi:hypothetical protein
MGRDQLALARRGRRVSCIGLVEKLDPVVNFFALGESPKDHTVTHC